MLLDLLRGAEPKVMLRMLGLTVLAGFANAFLVVAVNNVAGLVAAGDRPGIWLWLAFGLAFAIYYLSDKWALLLSNGIIEGLLHDLRIRVIAKLRRTELQTVDAMGRGHLYTLVSQETNHLSVTFPLLIDSFQQAVLLGVSLIYLGYLSLPALLVFMGAMALGVLGYVQINQSFRATQAELGRYQARLLDAIAGIIDGAKELRLNSKRSDGVFAAYRDLSRGGEALLIRSGEHWTAMVLLSAFVVYFMLGVVGFVFPLFIDHHSTIIFQLVPTLLFCVGPLTKIVVQSPMFMRADVGLQAIAAIERQLDDAPSVDPEQARQQAREFMDFQRISYRNLEFTYRSGAAEFHLGPLNLELQRGELLFLVGGNGSGKSTSLRVMTGLYPRQMGEIRVDDQAVGQDRIGGFRELFAAIFADFHLFDRIYGAENVDPGQVRQLIDEMGLSGKVRYEDGSFSDLNLSTGQRKRLALIIALLEDRPIYVFDEWSAEQDVQFREYFYKKILPDLKRRGKTVIAVTHDDRFWHVADRVVKLDLGVIEWEKTGRELEEGP